MKKVLYIIQLPPPIYGVTLINKTVFESGQINTGIEKDLLVLNYSKSLAELKTVNFAKIITLIKLWLQLLWKLIFNKPQFVYYTVPPIKIGFYKEIPNLLLIKLFKVKLVYHLHGKGINEKVTSGLEKFLYSFFFSNSLIIHLSEGLYRSEFSNIKVKNSKFFSVPNGIEIENVSKVKNDEQFLDLLFLSNIQKSKGIFLLLEVFEEIQKKHSHIRLNIVGGFRDIDTEKKIFNFLKSNGLENKINMWGPQFGSAKHQIISDSDILIHPSYNDALPLVILEAMQHGLAIIGSNQGAIPEIIENDFGFVFPTGDKEKLEFYLDFLITNNAKRKEMQHNAKKKFFEAYTKEHFEKRMSNIFNQF